MSDIQYVQRPFQQFCTKTISICPSCSTQLKLCSTNNHPCSPVSKKITIHVHYVPRQITVPSIFPEQTASFPTCFHEFTRNIDSFQQFSSMFQPFSNHSVQKSPFSTKKCQFSPDFPSSSRPRSSTAALSKGAGRVAQLSDTQLLGLQVLQQGSRQAAEEGLLGPRRNGE